MSLAALRLPNNDNVHKMLEGGYSSMPQPQDTEKYAIMSFRPPRLLKISLPDLNIMSRERPTKQRRIILRHHMLC